MSNMPPIQFVPPIDVYLRLEVVASITGVPAGTMKESILRRELHGMKQRGAWHTRLSDYNTWIEAGEASGAPLRTTSGRVGRIAGADATGSPPQPKSKPGRTKRCKPGKRIVVYDDRPPMVRSSRADGREPMV